MSGAPRSVRGRARAAKGLAALADLINDTLAGSGTQAVPAGCPVRDAGWLNQSALESTSPNSKGSAGSHKVRLGGRSSRALRSADAPPPQVQHDGDTSDDASIDDEHVETWRIVRLAQDGDGEAFGVLYDRYVDSVFRFIYYRVNDRALAEDFTSETFVRALRRINAISYQGRDIGAWFTTIARNIVLDHVKSARNRLEITTADTVEAKEHAASTESMVLESLASERLMAAVAKLGDEQRECVMLRFIQGLSVNETAAVMGKNDGAIKALQHRAVRKLADLVGGDLR